MLINLPFLYVWQLIIYCWCQSHTKQWQWLKERMERIKMNCYKTCVFYLDSEVRGFVICSNPFSSMLSATVYFSHRVYSANIVASLFFHSLCALYMNPIYIIRVSLDNEFNIRCQVETPSSRMLLLNPFDWMTFDKYTDKREGKKIHIETKEDFIILLF